MWHKEGTLSTLLFILRYVYVFSLLNNQVYTSEDEDFNKWFDKYKVANGKSEDELMWEAHCSFSDMETHRESYSRF